MEGVMTLNEAIDIYKNQLIRIGPRTCYCYFGIAGEETKEFMEFYEKGSLDLQVIDICKSALDERVITIIYDSKLQARCWTLKEFQKSSEWNAFKQNVVSTKEDKNVRRPKKLTYIQKRELAKIVDDPENYRLFTEDDYAWGVVRVDTSGGGGMKINEDDILWINKTI